MFRKSLFDRVVDVARDRPQRMPKGGRRPSRDEVLRQDHADLSDRLAQVPSKQ